MKRLKDIKFQEIVTDKKNLKKGIKTELVTLIFKDKSVLTVSVDIVVGRVKGPIDGYDVQHAINGIMGTVGFDDTFVKDFHRIMWRS